MNSQHLLSFSVSLQREQGFRESRTDKNWTPEGIKVVDKEYAGRQKICINVFVLQVNIFGFNH